MNLIILLLVAQISVDVSNEMTRIIRERKGAIELPDGIRITRGFGPAVTGEPDLGVASMYGKGRTSESSATLRAKGSLVTLYSLTQDY